jgi:predicted RNase H-like nuclease (RuvC/YqgF family)
MKQTQEPMKVEDLQKYLLAALTGEVEPKDRKRIQKLSKAAVSLQDAVVVAKALMEPQEQISYRLMETIQVQDIILRKLGATDEMVQEAQAELQSAIEEQQKRLEEAKAQVDAEKAEVEDIGKEIKN